MCGTLPLIVDFSTLHSFKHSIVQGDVSGVILHLVVLFRMFLLYYLRVRVMVLNK